MNYRYELHCAVYVYVQLKPIVKQICVYTSAAAPGPITVTVCASNFAGDCCGVFTDTVQVKYCQTGPETDDFYVYRLKNVPFCDMAYCAVGSYDQRNGTHFQRFLYRGADSTHGLNTQATFPLGAIWMASSYCT